MKKFTTLTLGALSLVALASACNVDVAEPQEFTDESQEAACNNEQAINSVLAAMATDAALDMGRWLPDRDFVFTNGTLALSSHAWPKCPNRNCARIYARLQLQDWDMHGTVIGGEPLDVGVLRSRLASNWQAQMTCIQRPDNNANDNCPWQQHDLQFLGTTNGACGLDYNFKAWVGNTTPRYSQPLAVPGQLKNMLIWAGHPSNPYLNFFSAGQDVRIDPPAEPPPPPGGGTNTCEYLTQYSNGSCQAVLSAASNVRTIGACCRCGTGPGMSWQWRAGVPAGTWYHCK